MKLKSFMISACIIICMLHTYNSYAQGCVAIRGSGGASCSLTGTSDSTGWLLNVNNRYFKSYKHFVGSKEQHERTENGTEVINHTFNMDILVQRQLNPSWAVAIIIPMMSNARSSLYEHGGNAVGPGARHSTHSFGLGDVRLIALKWLRDPVAASRWNVQAGLGIKLPTGDYRYQDYFHRNDSLQVLGPVDQSIQLGDGGTGISAELNAFYRLTERISAYANVFYLANPREQNGVSTARGGIPTAAQLAYGSNVMSVPDQYMLRAGFNVAMNRFSFSVGVRKECIPVTDLIGGSNGFRRPGYIVTFEPGMTFQMKQLTLYALLPVALERNRTQSVPDRIRTQKTGAYAHGDAAFADYALNAGAIIRF